MNFGPCCVRNWISEMKMKFFFFNLMYIYVRSRAIYRLTEHYVYVFLKKLHIFTESVHFFSSPVTDIFTLDSQSTKSRSYVRVSISFFLSRQFFFSFCNDTCIVIKSVLRVIQEWTRIYIKWNRTKRHSSAISEASINVSTIVCNINGNLKIKKEIKFNQLLIFLSDLLPSRSVVSLKNCLITCYFCFVFFILLVYHSNRTLDNEGRRRIENN